MNVILVGADFEENLGVGMIAAAALSAGHPADGVAFNTPDQRDEIARRLARRAPDVIGLSMQFQHRAAEFLSLATALRAEGYQGHITCGGQFATLAWAQVLGDTPAVDTVVLHDGEDTIIELLGALDAGTALGAVRGIALRDESGTPVRSPARPLRESLDDLPFAWRYRAHSRHAGVPFIPIMGSRGCWGSCTYCSITSTYRDARASGGGRTLRWRTPENVAAEMALLAGEAGGDAVFCFHDDTFLLPRADDSLARVRAIREALDGYGLGRIGIIGKCRPDSMTPSLARALRAMGVLRLYVGVENASEHGAADFRRAGQTKRVREALAACREAGIFVCYNLLIFEPDATLDDVRENVRFIREHVEHPVNFCRAEPYFGTPLQKDLHQREALSGSYLGWNYRIEDDRVELLFRICAAAFRQRNFDPEGVANRYMGLGYTAKLLEFFYDDPAGRRPALARRVREVTRGISAETADFLDRAVALASTIDPTDADSVERETARLGLDVAEADARWHTALDALYADMESFAHDRRAPRRSVRMPRDLVRTAQRVAFGASLASWVAACHHDPDPGVGHVTMPSTHPTGDTHLTPPNDPAPPPIMPVDPPPPPPTVVMPVDPPPPPPRPVMPPPDPLPPPPPRPIVRAPDPLPRPPPVRVDAGVQHPTGHVRHPRVNDPPPPPPHMVDPLPRPPMPVVDPVPAPGMKPEAKHLRVVIDQWRDTSTRAVSRSTDLPLGSPPEVSLVGVRVGDAVRVTLRGVPERFGARWRAQGALHGDGAEVTWVPASTDDQVCVAVRVDGGVAIAALRAVDIA